MTPQKNNPKEIKQNLHSRRGQEWFGIEGGDSFLISASPIIFLE
jgi:hypothetical protein